jgi:CHAT domain-containing protein
VRAQSAGHKVVHLACHGLVDQAHGNLFGALMFTPGPSADADPGDDGCLTLAEIYQLDMKGCELAVLSACNTNFGPEQRGEGVAALSRGFLVAGARRVVASNWLVDDEAAASLISYYCSGLAQAEKKGGPVDYAQSLHNAKRWVRQQEKWKSPYYWGTFVLVGPN